MTPTVVISAGNDPRGRFRRDRLTFTWTERRAEADGGRALRERPPELRAIYDAILDVSSSFGKFTAEAKKTSIHLVYRSAFAGVAVRKDALILTLKSAVNIKSPRVYRAEQVSPAPLASRAAPDDGVRSESGAQRLAAAGFRFEPCLKFRRLCVFFSPLDNRHFQRGRHELLEKRGVHEVVGIEIVERGNQVVSGRQSGITYVPAESGLVNCTRRDPERHIVRSAGKTITV